MNVLIVDDELLVRTGVQSLIQWDSNPFTLAGTARSAEEALTMVPSLAPVIIVTDICMSEMSGIDLMEQVRKEGYPAQFIVLTCRQDFETAKAALAHGAVDYLVKYDLKTEDFLRALHKAYDVLAADGNFADSLQKPISQTDKPQRHLLLLRIDDAKNLIQSRGRGMLTSSLTALISQVSGRGINARLLSSSDNVWIYEVYSADARGLLDDQEWRRAGKRIAAKLSSVLHISSRVFITASADSSEAIRRFDHLFCSSEQAVIETDGGSEEKISTAETADLRDRLQRQIAGMHLCVEHRNWKEFAVMGDEFFHLCKELRPQRRAVISEMSAMVHRIRAIDDTMQRSGWWSSMENSVSDAASLESLREILRSILNETGSFQDDGPACPEDIQRVLRFVEEHCRERITLHDAASLAHKSDSYFSSYFMKHMHMHFIDYVNRKRVEKACRLLLEGTMPNKEIAYFCGFSSEKYFLRVFKQIQSCTPKQWKSKNSIPPGSSGLQKI